jgi:hypothetical protein
MQLGTPQELLRLELHLELNPLDRVILVQLLSPRHGKNGLLTATGDAKVVFALAAHARINLMLVPKLDPAL